MGLKWLAFEMKVLIDGGFFYSDCLREWLKKREIRQPRRKELIVLYFFRRQVGFLVSTFDI